MYQLTQITRRSRIAIVSFALVLYAAAAPLAAFASNGGGSGP
jgi:hypothetical protein